MQRRLLIAVVSVGSIILDPALAAAQGFSCLEPEEPYAYHLDKSDPLYQTARDEFQFYLEEMEGYLLCLEQERAGAFYRLKDAYKMFGKLYGKDAVLRSKAPKYSEAPPAK